MKKLFGHNKQKNSKSNNIQSEDHIVPTPIHQQHAVYLHQQVPQQQQQQPPPQGYPQQPISSGQVRNLRRTSSEEDRWEVVSSQDEAQLRHQHHNSSSTPSRNSSYTSLPPGASPPIPSPNGARSPSPFSINTQSSTPTTRIPPHLKDYEYQQHQQYKQSSRKNRQPNAPVALGILRALDPPTSGAGLQPGGFPQQTRSYSEEHFYGNTGSYSELGHREERVEKKEKWGFWNRDKDKEKEKEREREREREGERERSKDQQQQQQQQRRVLERPRQERPDGLNELTRMIGYLTATASENWTVVLDVCEKASASEANAKEAVRALRREFKYGEPAAQLSAARLWAIMLRNSSEVFISQSTSRKFLDTLEELLSSSRTSPVVRERLLDVIAAAAYASGSKKDTGFRGLWRRVKPQDKPDEGVPFDNDDAMFNPPASGRNSHYEIPQGLYQEPVVVQVPVDQPPQPVQLQPAPSPAPQKRKKSPLHTKIIPPDEDIRRLFQECKIALGNASVLSQALASCRPEDLKDSDVIKEFYTKCRASHELIYAQIPWASAGAEQSRAAKNREDQENGIPTPDQPTVLTTEEQLLAALLNSLEELVAAMNQYEDLERVALERKAEDISRQQVRMDRRQLYQYEDGTYASDTSASHGEQASISSNHSRSNSPMPSAYTHHTHPTHVEGTTLAPPPPAPNGPRLPAHPVSHAYVPSRTPSPQTPLHESSYGHVPHSQTGHSARDHSVEALQNGMGSMHIQHVQHDPYRQSSYDTYEADQTFIQPSEKALGKRRVVEDEAPEQPYDGDELYFDDRNGTNVDDRRDSDDSDNEDGWRRHKPVNYVYDAVAERTMQRLREGQTGQQLTNEVH